MATWIGLDADKFFGRRLHQFLNMAGRIYYETHIAPLLRMQGFFNEFALDFETTAGERLPVLANASERRNSDGGLLFTAVVVIKATDRRRYERELVESRSQLRKGLDTERETAELREQFIAVLGHDLRNPLAAISAGARILQRSGALQEHKHLRVLDMINTTVTRMSDLIDDVLDFARGRLGSGIVLNCDAMQPLEPVLDQIVDELRTAAPDRQIVTSFEITEPVNCDRARVGQLMSNLVGNALTHGASDLPVSVGAKTDGGECKLWVANGGEPIPAAAMERLFEPFFRGDVRDSRQGLGLGLHIASQIAQAHGGRIDVSSTPNETRFVFKMPLARSAVKPILTPEVPLLLVVEDEFLIREDAAETIEKAGFLVIQAGSADEAVAILEARSDIHLVFTDIQMPGSMDGLRLAQLVSDRWPPIKILVTSGFVKVGPDDLPTGGVFLAKPYRGSEMIATLRKLLGHN